MLTRVHRHGAKKETLQMGLVGLTDVPLSQTQRLLQQHQSRIPVQTSTVLSLGSRVQPSSTESYFPDYKRMALYLPRVCTDHWLLHLLEKSWRQIFSPTGAPSQRAALDLGKLRGLNEFMELLKKTVE